MAISAEKEIEFLEAGKEKILEAIASGVLIGDEIEIRGRRVKHADLLKQLDDIDNRIQILEDRESGNYKPARTRAKLKH